MHTDTIEKEAYQRLARTAGLLPPAGTAFLVGGCVRDLLCGRQPADLDVAVSGQPEAYARQVAQRHGGRPIPIGPAEHRVFRVNTADRIFDITPLWGDSITADLGNRDFTINAMAFDITRGMLVDPQNGLADLRKRVLKAISARAFSNDPLRMLRAFRLGAQFECAIENQTRRWISAAAASIDTCAGERIRAELLKLFSLPGSLDTLVQMADTGLLFAIIPELKPLIGCHQNHHHSFDVWNHTLAAYYQLESLEAAPTENDRPGTLLLRAATRVEDLGRTALLKLAILLHDIGKPPTRSKDDQGHIHFYGHGRRGYRLANNICERLKCSKREREYLAGVVKNHNRPLFLFLLHQENRMSNRAVTRFFMQCDDAAPDILLHAVADFAGKRENPTRAGDAFSQFAETLLQRYFGLHVHRQTQPGLLNGRDLIDTLGLSPSPVFKKILARVETARLAGEIADKPTALALARRLHACARRQ